MKTLDVHNPIHLYIKYAFIFYVTSRAVTFAFGSVMAEWILMKLCRHDPSVPGWEGGTPGGESKYSNFPFKKGLKNYCQMVMMLNSQAEGFPHPLLLFQIFVFICVISIVYWAGI